jgi:hypothetical protein
MKTSNLTKEQIISISNYKKVGIEIEVSDIVKITQTKLVNGFILNQKQLHERAREIFPKEKIMPVAFSLQVDDITEEWIEAKMIEFGIKRNDLVKQLAITKDYLSLIFANPENKRKVHLSKPMKATFFYYFLTYELNRDFREQLT